MQAMNSKTISKAVAKDPVKTTVREANGHEAAVHAHAPVDFYKTKNYEANESVGYLMRRIISTVGAEVERQLEASDLTNAQWVPLLKLHMGNATTVAELARECELDAGAMTRLLDRIEAKGLCKRVRSSQDRRVVNLELTDAGQEAAKKIPTVLCRVQNAYLAGFSQAEWVMLKDFLRRILSNAQGAEAPTSAANKSPQ
jgi:DNA-binding MarR family transcriptional regulator